MITYRLATATDLESMSTIVGRAFAADSLPKIIPDTPAIREWWVKSYDIARHNPAARLLVAVDQEVVGVFTMTTSTPIITAVPLTPDHAPDLTKALEKLDVNRPKDHYLVELVAVDKKYQGLGIGRKLTQWACDIADESDTAIYLETSAAKDYYLKSGLDFKTVKGDGAGGILIRPKKSDRV